VGFIIKREHRLADGRELIYFDDADSALPPGRAPDERVLEGRPATAHMRQDVLTGEWISVATTRQNRVVMPPPEFDPLAPQGPGNPSEIPSDYDVAVFENRSPSFGPALASAATGAGIAIGRSAPAIGRCEVVCFSPARAGSFGSISRSRARTVIEAWADRTAALSALPGIAEVFPFENRGAEIGVTLPHPHGQIYGYPYVTPRTQRLISALDGYGPRLLADVLASERAGERVVLAGEHWTAYVPFAARWPIEVHMMPHEHTPDFAATSHQQRDELAGLYLRLLRGLDAVYDLPAPYIAAWHQAPVASHRGEIRLTLQLTSPLRGPGLLKYQAGSESAMGAWVADIAPEEQAGRMREAITRADAKNPV
jgi:UDPglucose--hexose-1-phosphate uridylyltransferase